MLHLRGDGSVAAMVGEYASVLWHRAEVPSHRREENGGEDHASDQRLAGCSHVGKNRGWAASRRGAVWTFSSMRPTRARASEKRMYPSVPRVVAVSCPGPNSNLRNRRPGHPVSGCTVPGQGRNTRMEYLSLPSARFSLSPVTPSKPWRSTNGGSSRACGWRSTGRIRVA